MGIIVVAVLLIYRAAAQENSDTGKAQSTAQQLQVLPFADRTLFFNLSEEGESKPILWGLDLAWLDEGNIRRGIAYMGKERIDVVRSSFMPTQPLNNGKLQGDALANTNLRIQIINRWLSENTRIVLNCDHPGVHSWYYGHPENWAALIDVTTKMHQDAGRKVVTVSPFNEPDFGWGQGTIEDFLHIAMELRKNSRFDSIRISGGNTLNTDQALPWYNYLKSWLDEGNTHQLAGSFDNYAAFYQAVRANGDHATNDELHNVMEAMVGAEYGLQTGIWWGTAEYARGEFVKASDGKRLAYAEHRENWTAASVYRALDGKVQAFIGGSERQAATTTFKFISRDRDVYFDGTGPQREFIVELPGGTPGSYQNGQTNAEKVVNITWGEDIQPHIDGKYVLVNRNSGKVMGTTGGSSANGTNIVQNSYSGGTFQQWNVNPINPRNGGDFSYYTITGVSSGKPLDVYNFSLENGGNVVLWEKGTWWDGRQSPNQVWYLEYAGDGWFYIRNQFSDKCLEVAGSSTLNGANIQQNDVKGGYNQHWRFLPVDTEIEFDAPAAPAGLVATPRAESVKLEWTPNQEDDVAGYTVFRSENAGGPFNTIARNVKTTAFVDNACTEPGTRYYKIKAVDNSLNSSPFSEMVEATTTNEKALVAHYPFNGNTRDSSINLNHGATLGKTIFVPGKVDSLALLIDNDSAFVQLPATVANQHEITVAAWVYCNERSTIQRIFEFRNDDQEYMYLTPRLRFAIKNSGSEQRLNAPALPAGEWVHVAVTLGPDYARLYRNGELADESAGITIRPADFKPVLNYIGAGPAAALRFNGRIDDFSIYNYELSPEEIADLASRVGTDAGNTKIPEMTFKVYPVPASQQLNYRIESNRINRKEMVLGIYNISGNLVHKEIIGNYGTISIGEIPSGVYLLKVTGEEEFPAKRIIISH